MSLSSSDLEKCSIASLDHQWIICSEWVPSEWKSKQLMKHHNSPHHSSPVKRLNQERNLPRPSTMFEQKQSKTALNKYVDRYLCEKQQGMHFFPGGSILWIIDYFGQKQQFKVKNALMMDLFLTNMQLLASQDIKWWTGVVWIIVMFLSAVWTLILTAPIHCRAYIDE